MFREESGAAALSGRDMPTDQTLAAHASVGARAREYAESGVFPDGTRMDQYRVAAYLDLLNRVAADVRIAAGVLPGDRHAEGGGGAADDRQGDGPDDSRPEDGEAPDDGCDQSGAGCDGQARSPAAAVTPPSRLADLVVPLATLLGLGLHSQ